MPEHPRVDIRFYNSTGSARRLQSKDTTITAARWKSVRYGGFHECSLTLAGDITQFTQADSTPGIQPLRENDRVRVYVGGELRWSGYVGAVGRSAGDPPTVTISALGVFSRVSAVPVNGRFVSPYEVDISQAFASFAQIEGVGAYPDLYVDVASADIGVLTRVEDSFNKTLGGTFSELSSRFAGLVVYGCDELHEGELGQPLVDRLFLRPIGSLSDPDYTLETPGAFRGAGLEMAEGGQDLTRLANILTLTGTTPLFPNYLGEATNGNVAFERPIFNETTVGGLLTDPSFEVATSFSFWNFYGGATQKVASIEGIAARSGERYVELDAVGEGIDRTVTRPLVAGQTLVAGIHAKRENAAFGGSFVIKIQFKNGGADVGALQQSAPITPLLAAYREESFQVTIPALPVTGYVLSYEMVSGGGDGAGICLDDSFSYVPSLRQDGWRLVALGTAVKNSQDWAHSANRTEGRYSFKFDISASDSDGNDAYLEPVGKFAVNPGALIEFGTDFRAWAGETNGKLRLDLRYFKEDGEELSGSGDLKVFNAGTLGDSWQQISNESTVPNQAAFCLVRVTFRGATRGYLDRLYVRDTAAPMVDGQREWIDAGPYRATFTTDDAAFTGKDYHDSISTYGRRYESIQSDSVADLYTALAVAEGFFDAFALPLSRPILKIVGSPVTFKPGQTVRVAGAAGRWLGGNPATGNPSRSFAITEVEETVGQGGEVHTSLSLEIEQPTLESMVERIFNKQRRSLSGGGVPAFSATPAGRGSSSQVSIALPLAVASGGTAATTAADARTNLGLGSGLSVTVPLAKLTPAGTDGSITTVNGVVTARVDPT
jgi:hypothetical protein